MAAESRVSIRVQGLCFPRIMVRPISRHCCPLQICRRRRRRRRGYSNDIIFPIVRVHIIVIDTFLCIYILLYTDDLTATTVVGT